METILRTAKSRQAGCRGTTLLEVALMTVIIGVAIAAMMQFLTSATYANRTLAEQPIGNAIARAGHEWARAKDPVELLTYFVDGSGAYHDYSPGTPDWPGPSILDIRSTLTLPRALAGSADVQSVYSEWSQRFSMRPVLINEPKTRDPAGTSKAVELTVTALKRGQPVCNLRRLYYVD